MPLRVGLALTALLALGACFDGAATQPSTMPPDQSLPVVDPIDLSGTGTVELAASESLSGTRSVGGNVIGDPRAADVILTTDAGAITGIEVDVGGLIYTAISPSRPIKTVPGGVAFSFFPGSDGVLRTGIVSEDETEVAPLNYMVYGTWSEEHLTDSAGHTAIHAGNRTPLDRIPGGGAATYTGSAVGKEIAEVGGAFTVREYRATVGLSTDNFQDFTFVTSNTMVDGMAASGKDMSGTLGRNGNTLGGPISGNSGSVNGSVSARFYGPDADEIGGVFSFSDATESTVASFGATQNPAFVSP